MQHRTCSLARRGLDRLVGDPGRDPRRGAAARADEVTLGGQVVFLTAVETTHCFFLLGEPHAEKMPVPVETCAKGSRSRRAPAAPARASRRLPLSAAANECPAEEI